MFKSKNVVDLFPTGIYVFEAEDPAGLAKYLDRVIATVRKEEGWDPDSLKNKDETLEHLQSNDMLHLRPDFSRFVEFGMEGVRGALDFLRVKYENVGMTSLWFNVSRPGYSHKTHVHPNNILSGVYYLRGSAKAGDIVFDDPRPQASVLLPDIIESTKFNAHSFQLPPEPGQLVMFPSWLPHRVAVNRGDEERISISFNVMLKGAYGFAKAYA